MKPLKMGIKGIKIQKAVPILISDSARRGFKNAFALGGYPIKFLGQNHTYDDSDAIMNDWRMVGNDICRARENYRRNEFNRIRIP